MSNHNDRLGQPGDHHCDNPNCPGPDYGPQECARCTRPIHGGPDYCTDCQFDIAYEENYG